MTFDYDYLIIGSGFGGSVAALRLAEKGYRVGVLERGRRFREGEYPATNWELWNWLWKPKLGCTGIQEMTLLKNTLVLSGAGVGGGSLVYCAVLLEPPEPFFRDPQWAGLEADWQETLRPHYQTARRMLGVTPNPRLWKSDELLREYAREIGREAYFKPTEVGIYFGDPDRETPDPYFDGKGPARRGCDQAGRCMVGCNGGGKNSLDRNYLHLAEFHGAEIFPFTLVTRVEPLPDGGYRIVSRPAHRRLGREKVWHARGVVVAAGALGTNHLLLQCKRKGYLPLLSDQLGQTARTNSEILLGVTADNPADRYCEGIAITSSLFVDETTHVEPVRYPEGSNAMFILGTLLTDGGGRLPRPLKYLFNIIRHPLQFVRTLNPRGWAKRSVILLVMQTEDNKMAFRLKRRWLMPWKYKLGSAVDGRAIPSYLPAANAAGRALARKMPGQAKNAITEVVLNTPLTAHIMGGCVIGADRESGVIDKKCQVFGYENMYIVDGAALPANLGVNPSLTITALAEYAMSHIPTNVRS
ncbi:MAG TPA: GMC family oxidoreductase [bacterium]|nr:GMC family oxidoreductase [bacterium]HOC26038.1 GMC family oxidoreductase [bacterium]